VTPQAQRPERVAASVAKRDADEAAAARKKAEEAGSDDEEGEEKTEDEDEEEEDLDEDERLEREMERLEAARLVEVKRGRKMEIPQLIRKASDRVLLTSAFVLLNA
jgi:hypothetical protein